MSIVETSEMSIESSQCLSAMSWCRLL